MHCLRVRVLDALRDRGVESVRRSRVSQRVLTLSWLVSCCLVTALLLAMSNHFALSLEAPPENTFALSPVRAWTLLLLVFAAVHVAALFTPPLLDDADATHADCCPVYGAQRRLGHVESGWHPLPGEAAAAVLAGRRRLPPLRIQRLRHPSASDPGGAWPRHSGLGLGPSRLWRARGVLCRPQHSDQRGSFSLHPHLHSRSPADPAAGLCSLQFSHWTGRRETLPLLPDLGRAGAGHVGQGPGGSGLLLPCRRALPAAHRRLAPLA